MVISPLHIAHTTELPRPFFWSLLLTDGKPGKFDSLVFANIAEMAKYATSSEAGDEPSDEKFEVVLFPHMPKRRVLRTALRATVQGLRAQRGQPRIVASISLHR